MALNNMGSQRELADEAIANLVNVVLDEAEVQEGPPGHVFLTFESFATWYVRQEHNQLEGPR